MAVSMADGIIAHKQIVGVQFIWKTLIAHHITNLEQLDLKSSKNIMEIESERWDEHVIKNNLNLKVLKSAKQYQIGFKSEEIEKDLDIVGGKVELYDMLEGRNRKGFCKKQSLKLFFREQLLNRKGNSLLTWGQIRQIRGKKGSGKKLAWFEEVELKMLYNTINREVREEFKTEGINQFAIILALKEILKKRGNRSLVDIEHWCKKKNLLGSKIVLEKCEGCEIGQEQEEASCVIAARFKNRKRALPKSVVQKENNQIMCNLNMRLEEAEAGALTELGSDDRQIEIKEIIVNAREENLIEEWIVEKDQIEKLKRIWSKMKHNKK
ncbi:13303_t:CDS:2 [Gigaspora margarita]|uniref:13303_t:CDS:1 n=1 Tax=Gigaspora margarita TaxID=4874 RepID=A0ABN7UZ26_GIGMA|nr:13303_t:CDS:2 [Gigaspora margarita]